MGSRNEEVREELKNGNAAAVGDALLFATMCIIGMPVDVYAKDGSVYSGFFHTASVDKDYAIVLKKARMVEKGNLDGNAMNVTLIETLIVQSEDLVQVVAKGVLLPSNGISGCAGDGSIEAAVGCSASLVRDAEVVNPNESKENEKYTSQIRFSVTKDNEFQYSSTSKAANHLGSSSDDHIELLDIMKFVKIEEAHNVSVNRRNVKDGGGSLEIQCEIQKNPESHDKRIIQVVQGTSLSMSIGEAPSTIVNLEGTVQQEPKDVSSVCCGTVEDQGQHWPTKDVTACTVASQPKVSVVSTPMIDANLGSCLKASSNPFLFVPPKSSDIYRAPKDSKLNPGAKTFFPSILHQRTVSSAMPNGARTSVPYMAAYTMGAPQEAEASAFTHSSMPVKVVPYNTVAVGHGVHDAAYAQPILGQVMNRLQPARFTGQYQNFQMGPAYVHPNPHNVILGRMGPVVCMHPMPTDVVQSAAGFSPAPARPLVAKHQGSASAQALQLCMSPPTMANGPQQFVMPTAIPISQPAFPLLQPIAVPGANGFLSTKYA